ncbi:MAG: UDP-glucose 4-epimerase GalE [Rubrivivax sp.]|nr:UDP-glucose 4-epimerase GalE [Rubrivivax sp.]
MQILVTGGAGYIASHTALSLIEQGHVPVLLDNFVNSKPAVIDRLEALAGQRPVLLRADVRDAAFVAQALREHRIEAVIHFAALKAVGESVEQPLAYYDNNINGTLALLAAMRQTGVKTLVFSSSATVYSASQPMPLSEDGALGAVNPYGRTKLMVEQILADVAAADPTLSFTSLRYFNPVGAHPSGTIGEDPRGTPNNLMPYVAQVAVGRLPRLRVFGNDYPTPDGTGVRDYIHVCDLAEGHVAAIDHGHGRAGYHVFNLGTGKGSSVMDVLEAFSRACGKTLPYEVVPRRAGDVAACWADPATAQRVLGWTASRTLEMMCDDAWRWQSRNPLGFPD